MKKILYIVVIMTSLMCIVSCGGSSESNQITYTSVDGNIINPANADAFGADISSNKYKNGVGTIRFKGKVTKIGDKAFEGCSNLESITIPESVETVGDNPFYGCDNLSTFNGKFASSDHRCLVVNGTLKAFAPAQLQTYEIKNDVTQIGANAFAGCENLNGVLLPEKLNSIGERAFSGCSSLLNIIVPTGVTTIPNSAFSDCSSLSSVTMLGDVIEVQDRAFQNCKNLRLVVIPDSVTIIGEYAFDGCDSLKGVVIPKNVSSIGNGAFGSVKTIYCNSQTPAKIETPFGDALEAIYIMNGGADVYKSSEGWNKYEEKICDINAK